MDGWRTGPKGFSMVMEDDKLRRTNENGRVGQTFTRNIPKEARKA